MSISRRRTRLLILAATAFAVVLVAWNSFRPPVPLHAWRVTSDSGFSGRMIALRDGTICAADLNTVFALDRTGREQWRLKFTSDGGFPGAIYPDLAALDEDTLLIARMDAVDRRSLVRVRDGKVVREESIPLATTPMAGPFVTVLRDGLVFGTPEGVLRLGFGGAEQWRYSTAAKVFGPPAATPDGGVVFVDRLGPTNWMTRLNPDGSLRWRRRTDDDYGSGPAFGADGSIYWGRGTNQTLAAFDPDGNPRWLLRRSEVACSPPSVGTDGTIFVAVADPFQGGRMLAVAPTGQVRWGFELGRSRVIHAPVIGVGGTLYFASMDRWVRAVDRSGRLVWRYRVPWRFDRYLPVTGGQLLDAWRNRFGFRRPAGHGPPLLGPDGVLYVNYNQTGTIYAFEVEPAARHF